MNIISRPLVREWVYNINCRCSIQLEDIVPHVDVVLNFHSTPVNVLFIFDILERDIITCFPSTLKAFISSPKSKQF